MMTIEQLHDRVQAEARLFTLVEEPDWCWECGDAILRSQESRTTFVEIESGPTGDIWEVRIHSACGK